MKRREFWCTGFPRQAVGRAALEGRAARLGGQGDTLWVWHDGAD